MYIIVLILLYELVWCQAEVRLKFEVAMKHRQSPEVWLVHAIDAEFSLTSYHHYLHVFSCTVSPFHI